MRAALSICMVLMIDIQARAMALVGNPDGPHAAVQPSLGFDLGF
jgi:hypothetical protein